MRRCGDKATSERRGAPIPSRGRGSSEHEQLTYNTVLVLNSSFSCAKACFFRTRLHALFIKSKEAIQSRLQATSGKELEAEYHNENIDISAWPASGSAGQKQTDKPRASTTAVDNKLAK
jgi:hypothetical protein